MSSSTLQATASGRVMDLSKPKKLPDGYQPCRDVVWKVSVGARNAVASNRYYTWGLLSIKLLTIILWVYYSVVSAP